MDYLSVREAAENWGISQRRVQKLCEQSRVPGAQRFGHSWMLPKDVQKPEDQRLTPKKANITRSDASCPADNPLPLLKKAWALKTRGLDEEFSALLRELLPLVKTCEDGKLYGEWLLLSSFTHHPRLGEMIAVLKEAAKYFRGECSRVILPSSLFPFASLAIFSIYHTEPGRAQQEARLLDEYISLYAPLTGGHGAGADISYRAEMLFYSGDLNASEILAYKALYSSQEKKQASVQLSSALLLGNIALCKGDAAGWQSAVDAMSLKHKDAYSPAVQSMADAMRGILLLELTNADAIAPWLKAGDFERLRALPQLLPFAHFVHAQYLCRKGEFARLIGFTEALYPDGIPSSPILDALLSLAVATARLNTGDKVGAEVSLRRAADSTLPDGLIFPFLSYIQLLGKRLDVTVKESYPACVPAFQTLKNRMSLGAKRLGQYTKTTLLPDNLTLKEREVALLAARGLRNAEIAERLSVTENTVRYHLRSVFHKLDVDRRVKLAQKLL